MNLILKLLLSFVVPISAHSDIQIFKENPVVVQWSNYGDQYEYSVEIYTDEDIDENLVFTSEWSTENLLEIGVDNEQLYFWKLFIKEVDKDCNDTHQCLNIESGFFYLSLEEEISDTEQTIRESEIPISKKAETENTIKEKTEEIPEEVLGTRVKKPIDREPIKETEKEDIKKEEVISRDSEENFCVYRYNIKKDKFFLEDCKIETPKVISSTYQKYNEEYIVKSNGKYIDSINIHINTVSCKNFNILDPKTWFKCQEVLIRSDNYDNVKLNHQVYFLDDQIIPPSNYFFGDNNFEISNILATLPNSLAIKGYFSTKHNNKWLDKEMNIVLPIDFKEDTTGINGIYSFPFDKIVHVNQWHGCTDYQCPHKGIDFASVKENIYASDNGIVISKGYDTYSGECNSGGNYLVVKYDSGHHMAYMHLEKDYVEINQRVNRGDLIALSGNSGSNNCQPLGYHLHFELREERSQNTHIDPVPFINIEWGLVKTNKSNIYPKRLSGDNPHPNF